MCWSGEASAVLAGIGIATTVYAAYKKTAAPLWLALGYFSLMEMLQAFTYTVIDQCSLPSNQIATLLGYLHIAFQPFFINALSLYFIPRALAVKFTPWVYTFCFFSAIFMIIQVYPFDWAGACNAERALCGAKLCSVSGNWHIAWELPTNSIGDSFTHTPAYGFPTYLIAAFIIPLLYGSWRITLYHYLVGPLVASLLTNNLNEWPAIWCLLSIGILLLVVKTRLREVMFVKSWWLWPKQAD
jgi:hypothetical protein